MPGSLSELRVVFMGTAEFAIPSLRHLAERSHVAAVVTQPDRPRGRGRRAGPPPVKLAAAELGIPVRQPEKLRDKLFRRELQGFEPDVIVVAAYGQLLTQSVLDLPRLGCVNVHPSLLPEYRGAAPIQWALWNGESETGVTIMQLDAGEDSGPILIQVSTAIDSNETAAELSERLALLGAERLLDALAGLSDGSLAPTPQDDALATRAPRLTSEMGEADWTLRTTTVYDHFRACVPWPGTYTVTEAGSRVRILRCRPTSDKPSGDAGTSRVASGRLLVTTGDGALEVTRLQMENRAPVEAGDFINGLRGAAPPSFNLCRSEATTPNG